MIDTHCHLTFPELEGRLEQVLAAAAEAGVRRVVTVGVTPEDAEAARRIAAAHEGVYFSAGVHPHYAQEVGLEQLPRLAEIGADRKCVAWGEMGLDYHYPQPPREAQRAVFEAQLELVRRAEEGAGARTGETPVAHKLPGAGAGLPGAGVILHCRKAVDDTLAVIRASGLGGERFVFHCFTEGPEEVRKVLDAGAMVSFTGIVTYRNAADVRAAVKLVPDDRIMVETDAPYLTPAPHRKVRPNEPRFVTATAAFLADLRGATYERFERVTDANAERFFGLGERETADERG